MAILFLAWLTIIHSMVDAFPMNEYAYAVDRDLLLQQERNFPANKLPLNQDEQTVNLYLDYLKQVEFRRTRPALLPSRPIEQVLDNVTSSQLYQALWSMPKGGNMHNHEPHLVSKKTLLDIVFDSEDFPHLYIKNESDPDGWKLDFYINPPPNENWINVKNSTYYTKERILQHQTLMNILDENARKYPTDTDMRWKQMNPLWGRGSDQLINNRKIKEKYIYEMLNSSLAEGVQYLETRRELNDKLYELSSDPRYNATGGKKSIDDKKGEVELNLTTGIVDDFIKANPSFIGVKFIIYSTRFSSKELIKTQMEDVVSFHEKYPRVIVGYDLVAEEDAGRSHLYFAKELLSLYDPQSNKPRINLFLHTAETNFPYDLKMSVQPKDPTSALQNTYDAVALGSKRVGHGTGFIKHPYLMKKLKENNVAVEVCPVSNQLLGFTPDIRNHPAVDYIRYGLPVVFGSDDPGTFGYDYFTVDWYMAYIGWGLDLADLKRISLNAIDYSAMVEEEKTAALAKLNTAWELYIDNMKTKACAFKSEQTPSFSMVFPQVGAKAASNKVYIFGENFQKGICNTTQCRFGNREAAKTELVSTQLIICESPSVTVESTVEVSVTFDGTNYLSTGQNFTYKHTLPETTVRPTPIAAGAPFSSGVSSPLVLMCLVYLFIKFFEV